MLQLDTVTLRLFGTFPREMGNPSRSTARNLDKFKMFINSNNGLAQCFTGVYDLQQVIDKIFYDFDGPGAIKHAQQLYKFLIENKYSAVPVATGKKGVHIYVILKPQKYDNAKQHLTNASYKILQDAYSRKIPKTVDTHVLGDIRRLCRIPNTLRPPENRTWCTYLPTDWTKFNEIDFENHIKSTHNYEYKIVRDKTLLSFGKADIRFDTNDVNSTGTSMSGKNSSMKLQLMLRPLLYKGITFSNPLHHIRVATTVDLINLGLSDDSIFKLYSELKWDDWDPDVTMYQIKHIRRNKIARYSDRILQQILGSSY